MKVTFFSNFLNHHQLPFCKEMYQKLGDDYKFVATEPVPEERLKLGYHDMSTEYPFALNIYSSENAYNEALKLGFESDVVIIGSASTKFIKERLASNKVTFYYKERIFKKGKHRILNPKVLGYLLLNHVRFKYKNLYMLCASAYTAADFNLIAAYSSKTYKWGYFPELIRYDLDSLMEKKRKNTIPKLLWVGRYLDWKHPDDAIKLAINLKKNNYKFSLDIIGTGPMEQYIKDMIEKNNLHNEVKLLGSMKPEEVRKYMEEANIFIFTSDFNEGWGAVLNESMNSGCAVVASHAIGAVPFLIKHGFNGYIYDNDYFDNFYYYVERLLLDEKKREQMGLNAYSTISSVWNANIASKRFIELSESLISGNNICYLDGPCSKADIIKNNWIKE